MVSQRTLDLIENNLSDIRLVFRVDKVIYAGTENRTSESGSPTTGTSEIKVEFVGENDLPGAGKALTFMLTNKSQRHLNFLQGTIIIQSTDGKEINRLNCDVRRPLSPGAAYENNILCEWVTQDTIKLLKEGKAKLVYESKKQ